jgi:hypothetical protein
MSEEIKEILDRLDFNEWEVDLYKVPITWTELYDVRDYITNLQKENKRLNNIINELEKILTEEYDYCDKHIDPAFGTGMGVAKRTLDKLKDLKDSD